MLIFFSVAVAVELLHWGDLIVFAVVVGLAIMSEFPAGSLETVIATFGLSEFFVGIILVPIIGNVAEHLVAVQVALKDQMDLSLSIALGPVCKLHCWSRRC